MKSTSSHWPGKKSSLPVSNIILSAIIAIVLIVCIVSTYTESENTTEAGGDGPSISWGGR